jgi:hypothetical protein
MKSSGRFPTWLAGLIGAALVLPAVAADEAPPEFGWTTRLVAEAHQIRRDSPFAAGLELTDFGRDRFRAEQELRGRAGPVSLLLTATESARQAAKPAGRLVANEAYADLSLAGERFTVGKKVLSGDVGYAFRPIDVLQRESRLQFLAPQLEGIPMVSWDNFSTDHAWSLVLANPGHQRRGEAREDGSLALKLYHRAGAADLHGILRNSSRYGLELGGAASLVPSDALEIHASLLTQRRGERRVPLTGNPSIGELLAADGALTTETLASPRKALVGGTWTTAEGFSVLGEFWWDGTAPTTADWRRLRQQATQRADMLRVPGVPAAAVAGATAASLRMFDQGNLVQRGLLTRLAWSDPGGGWAASADVLKSLADRGWTLTTAVSWQGDRLHFDAGLRRYAGPADSVYRLLPERGVAFLGVSMAY